MTHHLIAAEGRDAGEALEALTMRLSGRWCPTAHVGNSAALAASSHVRSEQNPSEIARKAIAYQDAQRARGVNVPTWQAVNAVM